MPKEEIDDEDALKKKKSRKMVVLDSEGSEIDEIAQAERIHKE